MFLGCVGEVCARPAVRLDLPVLGIDQLALRYRQLNDEEEAA
jgi:hypothetical protein